MENEILFRELLEKLPDYTIQKCLLNYISKNNLHSAYIESIVNLNKDYIDNSNRFIEAFKRNVNVLYTDNMFDKNVLKKVDIDKNNWFWYARLLKYTEDEVYPKRNSLQPTYLLGRLKPITDELTEQDLRDDEFRDLYNVLLHLYKKYEMEKDYE